MDRALGTFRIWRTGQWCPLIEEEQKFAASCQGDVVDSEQAYGAF
jgi:hypothetical protein